MAEPTGPMESVEAWLERMDKREALSCPFHGTTDWIEHARWCRSCAAWRWQEQDEQRRRDMNRARVAEFKLLNPDKVRKQNREAQQRRRDRGRH